MSSARKNRVVIIGGGPGGLGSLRVFAESNESWELRLFEEREEIGGVWSVLMIFKDYESQACSYVALKGIEGVTRRLRLVAGRLHLSSTTRSLQISHILP